MGMLFHINQKKFCIYFGEEYWFSLILSLSRLCESWKELPNSGDKIPKGQWVHHTQNLRLVKFSYLYTVRIIIFKQMIHKKTTTMMMGKEIKKKKKKKMNLQLNFLSPRIYSRLKLWHISFNCDGKHNI